MYYTNYALYRPTHFKSGMTFATITWVLGYNSTGTGKAYFKAF